MSASVRAFGCHAAQPPASKAERENAESANELLLAAALRKACISSQARPRLWASCPQATTRGALVTTTGCVSKGLVEPVHVAHVLPLAVNSTSRMPSDCCLRGK